MSLRTFYLFCLSLGLVFLTMATAYAADTVRDIRVTGNQRIEPTTVLSYLQMKAGDPITVDTIDQALKDLFATELFADVQVTESAGVITVAVVENPIISEIAFEGNDALEDAELTTEISLRPRMVFTRTKVQNDVARLYDVYRKNGRFSVVISPKIIKLDQNRVNLVFEITEGDITEIRSIRFVGNKRFNDDTLRGELATKESRWYRFLNNNDRYDGDRFNYDQELLRRFYLSEGYADFRILSAVAELSESRDDFYLTLTVDEGPRYKVGKIDIQSGLRNFDANTLRGSLTLVPGDWYDADAVEDTIEEMTEKLNEKDQIYFVSVTPDVQRHPEDKTIDIIYRLAETAKVFVERVDIKGNMRTEDKVIRREIRAAESDAYIKSDMAKSERDLRDLDYFEKVDVKSVPGSAPDKRVVEIDVEEKSTGELSVGAGFSTSEGPLADFRLRERNFLGKGQDVVLATTLSGEKTEFDVSVTEPYFMDRDLAATVDAFHITRDLQDESSYDQKRSGAGLKLSFPLSEKWRQAFGYRLERNEITNVDSDASRYIRDQEGNRVTSAVNQRLSYTDLDSTLFPTEGYTFWLENEISGLGGDSQYFNTKIGNTVFYPIADNWILSGLLEAGLVEGYGDEAVSINERFFIGGNTLRGFDSSGIGPRDLLTDDALGGNRYYRGSAELRMPIGLPEEYGIAGYVFTDFGSLWKPDSLEGSDVADESSLRASAGVGLSWRSPMGPLRIDYAKPYMKEDYDVEQSFRFSFGTQF
ncbi:MAG: outer membrane protein assembly factor BamA [Pseudomonadota bacterium]